MRLSTLGLDLNKFKEFFRQFKKSRVAVFGSIVIAFFVILALFSPLIAPYDPFSINLRNVLQPPDSEHVFGTDHLGRDCLSRLILGTRTSLLVGFMSAFTSIIIGVLIGGLAGYYGGLLDEILAKILDIFWCIPMFFTVILVAAILGHSTWHIIVLFGVLMWPTTAKLARAEFLTLKSRPFVEAAKASGAGNMRIIFSEILPNGIYSSIVNTTLQIASAILYEASVSFLGLGDPNAISLGWLLRDAMGTFRAAWWMSIPPGVFLSLVVLAFNFVGDGLNDALNPALKER